MTKREHLVELLIRYPEALPAYTVGGHGGGGSMGMPTVWFSYPIQELERCLGRLRTDDGSAYRHVVARFVSAERVQKPARLRGGRLEGLPERSQVVVRPTSFAEVERDGGYAVVRVVALVWPAWVDATLVGRGLTVLERSYRGEPELPREMVAA